MIKPGESQELRVVKMVTFGVYLADEEDTQKAGEIENRTDGRKANRKADREDNHIGTVLLPKREVPEGTQIGDTLTVFIYRDSQDRLISTMVQPKVTLYHTGLLTVKQVTRIGAFLDWGLPKDLLLPFHEQTRKVGEGEEVLVSLYLDKSNRLAATMNVYPYLRKHSPYQVGDVVKGRIYQTSDNFGVFVAVDDMFSALIPKKEAQGQFRIGDVIEARVTGVKEDGKLDLSPHKKAYLQMDDDAELVLKVIDEYDGVLPFSDNASPEVIRHEFGLSKAAFKRAVGHLMKEGKVRLEDSRIYRI